MTRSTVLNQAIADGAQYIDSRTPRSAFVYRQSPGFLGQYGRATLYYSETDSGWHYENAWVLCEYLPCGAYPIVAPGDH